MDGTGNQDSSEEDEVDYERLCSKRKMPIVSPNNSPLSKNLDDTGYYYQKPQQLIDMDGTGNLDSSEEDEVDYERLCSKRKMPIVSPNNSPLSKNLDDTGYYTEKEDSVFGDEAGSLTGLSAEKNESFLVGSVDNQDDENKTPEILVVTRKNAMDAADALIDVRGMLLLADSKDRKLSANCPKFTTYELNDKITLCQKCDPPEGFAKRSNAISHMSVAHGLRFCPVCFELISMDTNTFMSHLIMFHFRDLSTREVECLFCHELWHYEACYQHIASKHLIEVDNKFEQLKNVRTGVLSLDKTEVHIPADKLSHSDQTKDFFKSSKNKPNTVLGRGRPDFKDPINDTIRVNGRHSSRNMISLTEQEQNVILEKFYEENRFPDSTDMHILNRTTGLEIRQIQRWFRDRRNGLNKNIVDSTSTNFKVETAAPKRRRFTAEENAFLMSYYSKTQYPNRKDLNIILKKLGEGVKLKSVQNWFYNLRKSQNNNVAGDTDSSPDPFPSIKNEVSDDHLDLNDSSDTSYRPTILRSMKIEEDSHGPVAPNASFDVSSTAPSSEQFFYELTCCRVCYPAQKFSSLMEAFGHLQIQHAMKICPICLEVVSCIGDIFQLHMKMKGHFANEKEEVRCPICSVTVNHLILAVHIDQAHLRPFLSDGKSFEGEVSSTMKLTESDHNSVFGNSEVSPFLRPSVISFNSTSVSTAKEIKVEKMDTDNILQPHSDVSDQQGIEYDGFDFSGPSENNLHLLFGSTWEADSTMGSNLFTAFDQDVCNLIEDLERFSEKQCGEP